MWVNQTLKRGSYGMKFMVIIIPETTGFFKSDFYDHIFLSVNCPWPLYLVLFNFLVYRSYTQAETFNANPSVGFRGVGRGWNPRGRGRVPQSPHGSWHGATTTLNDHTRSQYTARGNVIGYNYRSNNHPARTNSSTGTFWSVRSTDTGSSSNEASNRWGDTQSRHGRGNANTDRWQRSNWWHLELLLGQS